MWTGWFPYPFHHSNVENNLWEGNAFFLSQEIHFGLGKKSCDQLVEGGLEWWWWGLHRVPFPLPPCHASRAGSTRGPQGASQHTNIFLQVQQIHKYKKKYTNRRYTQVHKMPHKVQKYRRRYWRSSI